MAKHKNNYKQVLMILLLILIGLLPNIISSFVLQPTAWMSLLLLSTTLILLPAVFLNKKYWLRLVFLFVLFSSFEIVTVLTTKSRINNVIIASIFSTSKNEASELLTSFVPLLILSVGLIIGFIMIWKRVDVRGYLNKKTRFGILVFSSLVLFWHFMKPLFLEKPKLDSRQSLVTLKTDFSYYIYPTNFLFNTAIFTREKIQEKSAIRNLKDFSLKSFKIDEKPQVIVFVIGETSRVMNWSLYGYEVKTNPELEKVDGLYTLSNTLSPSNSTFRVLPMLLSQSTPNNQNEWKSTGTLMRAFKESGYYTAWIGGQSKEHNIVKLANIQSDFVDLSVSLDELLFENAKETIRSNHDNIFVVIHTDGSHFDYQRRYPKGFNVFKPSNYINANSDNKTEIINAYNNSILYTDYLISDLIQFLEKDGRSSAIYYTADHGENLLDDDRDLMFHVHNMPTIYELHVPTFFWFSKSYQSNYQEKVEALLNNKDKKMSTTITFHSLLELGNISYPKEKKHLSVLSTSFEEFRKRYIITNLKEVVEYSEEVKH